MAYRPVQNQIARKLGGCATLRMASRKMVNNILDLLAHLSRKHKGQLIVYK